MKKKRREKPACKTCGQNPARWRKFRPVSSVEAEDYLACDSCYGLAVEIGRRPTEDEAYDYQDEELKKVQGTAAVAKKKKFKSENLDLFHRMGY
jgi:hypothetical protein